MKKILVFIVLFIFFISVIISHAGNFLVINEYPIKSDVIIVLSGDRGNRVELGVKLFHENYAPYLLLSGGNVYYETTISDLMASHATKLGVPEEKIIKEDRADSTYENAVLTKEILLERNLNSAIIVSSNYHMRRVKYVFNKIYKDTDIRLNFCSAKDINYLPESWLSNNKSIMYTITEYIKLIGYYIRY